MRDEPEARVATSRRRLQSSLTELRGALARSTGGRLGGRVWALPVLAAAAGFAVALVLRRTSARQ